MEMAGTNQCKGSCSHGKNALLCNDSGVVGEASVREDFGALTVSKCLVRNVSQKLGKKNHRGNEEEEGYQRRISSRCIGLYGRGGGCKVGADTCEEFGDVICRRKSITDEEGKRHQAICGNEETRIDCFSYGVTERFWKRNSGKNRELEESPLNGGINVMLPDDLLEMCLARLPLSTLMTARLVCKKWRSLTTTRRFMQMRREGLYRSPWVFLFGVVKDGYCSGHIHALDSSLDQWHKINAHILKGRFLFSVASIGDDVFVVGGCSSLTNFGKVDKTSFKTHRGVIAFTPLTRSFHKVAPMKHARSAPILGVFRVGSNWPIFGCQSNRPDQCLSRSRVGGVSNVYEDPHRLSLRHHLRDSSSEDKASVESNRKPCKFVKQESSHSNLDEDGRFILIAVGGLGAWDEPLNSGEIFDPVTNKWMDIPRLPGYVGVVCSGVVCNGMFYVCSETDKLAAYDLERGIWVGIQTELPHPRLHDYFPKLISCNGRLFMLSVSWCEQDCHMGWRDKAVRKLWELDLTFLNWKEVSRHPDAPMDWNGAFVSHGNWIFGIEMFKIFGQVLDFLTVCDVSGSDLKWTRISKKHVAHELDASSCLTKSMAVLHL
ncbi:F-box/kelch-repeat protein At5g42350-like isoform X3 [Telopea speciosissima]|uniref:F-box/kelch-repeat protein At5g42350-like isoform X2 n=1 Tax=Telopea speciosissima TaxID=54955 RepID=UPI001CC52558|nr:F-box/kelch-repeat protein At5g42350-like isoform X2 [Telopea speciosissima]XP_043711038.1 F-box/kelch-repeat protein At5g42350-like isoform X3 [Telopea speciosissima]